MDKKTNHMLIAGGSCLVVGVMTKSIPLALFVGFTGYYALDMFEKQSVVDEVNRLNSYGNHNADLILNKTDRLQDPPARRNITLMPVTDSNGPDFSPLLL